MFEQELSHLQHHHLLRQLRTIEASTPSTLMIEGRSFIHMASNNYLGLATHPVLKAAAIQAIEQYGVGAGASRLISGTHRPHQDLEEALAEFQRAPAALYFGSGYLANIALLTVLGKKGARIFADRLCHASLLDGCRLSEADFRLFAHNDIEHLARLLQRHASSHDTIIVTEGIFSMDGDMAPLPDLLDLAQRYQATLVVDDAHGTGVMGSHGRGTGEFLRIEARLPFHMGTCGKALGTSGAYVVGPQDLIDYLVNRARSFVYTTAPPPATAAATIAAIRLLQSEPERRTRLWTNREFLHAGLTSLGFTLTETVSPILPVIIGDPEQALAFSQLVWKHNVFAPAIRPPTVPKGSSRIRLTVTSEHSRSQLDQVLLAFQQAGETLGLL